MSTALHGEDRAFESLYRLYRSSVYAYALSRVRQPADADDVTQTTFTNAYCALHRGVSPRDELQWLLAIARNVCRDRFRDADRRPKEEPLAEWMRLVQPEEQEFSIREVCNEISHLNPRYRQALLMREFEGRSYAEISADFGVSEAAVQTLLSRARRALRDELELGITCAQARRTALRHLNGVASTEERRALKRHLRRCADCALFVDQRPRKPLAQILWLCSMPYRRLMALITGTAATPAGPTIGVTAKLLVVTAVGTTALGVSAKEVHEHSHPAREPAAPAPPHHDAGRALPPSARGTTAIHVPVPPAVAARNVHRQTPATTPANRGDAPVVLVPESVGSTVTTAGPSGATAPAVATATPTPTAPAAVEAAPPATAASADAQPTPADTPTAPVAAAPTSTPIATTPAPAATPDDSAPPAPTSETPAPTASGAAVSPPPATAPPGQANDPGVPRGNGVGRDGTPPGQAAKADGTHGHA